VKWHQDFPVFMWWCYFCNHLSKQIQIHCTITFYQNVLLSFYLFTATYIYIYIIYTHISLNNTQSNHILLLAERMPVFHRLANKCTHQRRQYSVTEMHFFSSHEEINWQLEDEAELMELVSHGRINTRLMLLWLCLYWKIYTIYH